MTEPSASATAGVSGVIEAIDRLKGYLSGYKPDTRSVTYDYRSGTSEMTVKITVPDNRGRKVGKVKIPREEGYEIREMFSSGDFTPVGAKWDQNSDYWILDPANLPAGENFMLRLNNENVNEDVFEEIIDLNVPEDPMSKSGVDQYWVQSSIRDPKTLQDIYQDFKINNVDLNIRVGVQPCFSTGIPDDVTERIERTRELIEASNEGDRNAVSTAHIRRREARKQGSVTEQEIASLIRSLANPSKFGEFISIESPYRQENIESNTLSNEIFPEEISVEIATNLDLEQQAAKGTLKFEKENYTEHIEEETADLL